MEHSKNWKIKRDFPKGISLEAFFSNKLFIKEKKFKKNIYEFPTWFFFNKKKSNQFKIRKFRSFGVYKKSDLNESKISFIGEIEDRIKEDYLRIYRYFRFRGLFNLPKTSLSDQKIVEKYSHESLEVSNNDGIRQEILKMVNMSFTLKYY